MRIEGHHVSMPDWRAHGVPKKGDLVGVELEVFHSDGNRFAADSLDSVDFGQYPRPIAEIDGSLCRVRGVELVLPPLPTNEVISDKGYVAKVMEALAKAGVTPGEHRNTGYGLHLNFNVAEWTPNERAVVQYALNAMSGVGQVVARRNNGFGEWMPRFNLFRSGRVSDTKGSRSRMAVSTWPHTKYVAAWIRGSGNSNVEANGTVMEFRAPRSTLDITDLQLAISYVAAVRQWAGAFGGDALAACYLDSLIARRQASPLGDEFLSYWHHVAPENLREKVRRIAAKIGRTISELERTPYEGMLANSNRLVTQNHHINNNEIAVGGIVYDSRSFKEQALRIAEYFSGFRQIFAAESEDESRSYRPPSAAAICTTD